MSEGKKGRLSRLRLLSSNRLGKLRVRYKGENHMIMSMPDGIQRAEFCGPGTHVKKRIGLGILPLNAVDTVCRRHDLDYQRITDSDKNKKYKGKQVRVADKRMVKSLKNKKGFNATFARTTIKAKMKVEDLGLLSRTKFVNPL